MKKITKLDESIKNYKGETIKLESGEEIKIKDMFLNVISGSRQDSGRDSMLLHLRAAPKIVAAEKEVELEDYDFSLVKKAIEQAQIGGLVKARLFEALGEKLE